MVIIMHLKVVVYLNIITITMNSNTIRQYKHFIKNIWGWEKPVIVYHEVLIMYNILHCLYHKKLLEESVYFVYF